MSGAAVSGAGGLRRRIIIEKALDTPDEAGGSSRAWETLTAVWAEFRLKRGGVRDRADRPALAHVWSVRMRWRDDLDGTHRLRDGARIYSILGRGDADGRRAWLTLTVEEETP